MKFKKILPLLLIGLTIGCICCASAEILIGYRDPLELRFTTTPHTVPSALLLHNEDYPMSTNGSDIDLIVSLQTLYKEDYMYTTGPFPAMIVDYNFSFLDPQDKDQRAGLANATFFAFPIVEKEPQYGIGAFENNYGNPEHENLTKLSYVGSAGITKYGKTANGTIHLEKTYILAPYETVQFLDFKLQFKYPVMSTDGLHAKVQMYYVGNYEDDMGITSTLGTYDDGSPNDAHGDTYFTRFMQRYPTPNHEQYRTWYARFEDSNSTEGWAKITVGKEIRAGDTFYVNSVRYDIPSVVGADSDGNGEADQLESIAVRTPFPRVDIFLGDAGIISSQGIKEFDLNDIVPVLPPYNMGYYVFIPNLTWNMSISATNQLEPVVVGVHPNATDGYDEYDEFTSTPVQGKVIMSLDDIYAKNIKGTRCYNNEFVTWKLLVGVPVGQNTTLSWQPPPMVNLTISKEGENKESGYVLEPGSHELLVTAEYPLDFTLRLKAGWNMISIPIIPDNSSVQAIFGSIPTLETRPISTWMAPQFIPVDEIEPKVGYWIFTPDDIDLTLNGSFLESDMIELKTGWNIIGTIGLKNLTISEIPNQVPERPAVTWVPPSFIEADAIGPGKSAWVFVTQNTILTYSESFANTTPKSLITPPNINRTLLTSKVTEEWNLTISATNQLEPVTFGIHPNATEGYDSEYDTFVQLPMQGKVIMILNEMYAKEINRERREWHLLIGVPLGTTTTLTWNSSEIPPEINLTLNLTDMKFQNSLQISEGVHSFVINGTRADLEPPESITNLDYINGTTWINWSWTNPPDADFNHTMVFLDDVWQINTSESYYNTTDLISNTSYEIGTHTVDKVGNINETWVNLTAKTAPPPDTNPPAAPAISSFTHPNESLWYCDRNPTFLWTAPADPSGIACYSYTLDHLASTTPDEACNTTGTTMSYTNLSSDTWYFHVRAKDNANNWGPAAHYRVQIENCDNYDGCYAYDTGCEDRDYYCNGTSCTYSYSNKHIDAYDDWVYYCSNDTLRKHRLFHDFYCDGGACTEHASWVEDQLIENCTDYDGWVDTNTTRWVEDPSDQSKLKEQKAQKYRDYFCSNGGCVYNVTATQWVDTGNTRVFFSTGPSAIPYPSLSGIHNGTITPYYDINVSILYTYYCEGTGGHTEYVKLWNSTDWNVTATWDGYTGDWHNISFNKSFTLYANETYNYSIRTGSYPQIIHESSYNATGGTITCSEFVDVNGKRYDNWIPAIRLE